MAPQSIPSNPAQPNQSIYGFGALQTVPTYTRASYLAAFGVQAPNFDATKAPKYWFDSTVNLSSPSNVAVYNVVSVEGILATITQLSLPASQAAAVNIPGLITYPPYVIQPTTATMTGLPPSGVPFNADVLSNQQDALNLANSFGLSSSAVIDGDPTIGPFVVNYPATETRRQWDILFKGNAVNVGIMIANMNANGVGAPGAWDLSGSQPTWVPAPMPPDGITSGVPAANSQVSVPVRALLPNEKIQTTLMGSVIARTDMSSAATTDTSAGGFTDTDRATLSIKKRKIQCHKQSTPKQ
jgi:hypothetical protein